MVFWILSAVFLLFVSVLFFKAIRSEVPSCPPHVEAHQMTEEEINPSKRDIQELEDTVFRKADEVQELATRIAPKHPCSPPVIAMSEEQADPSNETATMKVISKKIQEMDQLSESW